jgi:hypothetical protein
MTYVNRGLKLIQKFLVIDTDTGVQAMDLKAQKIPEL